MELPEITEYTDLNRRAWDVVARVRPRGLHSGALFARGVGTFDPAELPISDWRDRRVLHLQCASGEDTLTLALAGASVTGVDISADNIVHARRKAEEAGLSADFIIADVYELPAEVLAGRFDVVFTGSGALCWLPDIDRWAGVVYATLKAGGALLVEEMHPLRACFDIDGGRLVLTDEDYFQRGQPRHYPAGPTGLAGAGGMEMLATVQFNWPIGDLVTALARAGLRIELLSEYFTPPTRDDIPADVMDQLRRLPNDFTLLATKPAGGGAIG